MGRPIYPRDPAKEWCPCSHDHPIPSIGRPRIIWGEDRPLQTLSASDSMETGSCSSSCSFSHSGRAGSPLPSLHPQRSQLRPWRHLLWRSTVKPPTMLAMAQVMQSLRHHLPRSRYRYRYQLRYQAVPQKLPMQRHQHPQASQRLRLPFRLRRRHRGAYSRCNPDLTAFPAGMARIFPTSLAAAHSPHANSSAATTAMLLTA